MDCNRFVEKRFQILTQQNTQYVKNIMLHRKEIEEWCYIYLYYFTDIVLFCIPFMLRSRHLQEAVMKSTNLAIGFIWRLL